MKLKKIIEKVGTKGVFDAIFPKANNTKIGRLVSGVVNGASSATPLSFIQEFLQEFLDADGDGRVTIKDFKSMDIKTLGKAIGFLACLGVLYYLYTKYIS